MCGGDRPQARPNVFDSQLSAHPRLVEEHLHSAGYCPERFNSKIKAVAILRKVLTAAGVSAVLGLAFELGRSSNSEKRKQREFERFLGYLAKPNDVIDSFIEFLRAGAPANLKSFQNRLRADPEAAMAEAIVFGVLQQLQLYPVIADEPGKGGGDFLCKYRPIRFTDSGSWSLVVEATTLEPTSVERSSGWRNEVPEEIRGGAFSMITEKIVRRASAKVRQLSQHEMPRVLAIVSSHIGADALLSSALAAESVLVADRKISTPIGGGESTVITDLVSSAFLQGDPETGEVKARRKSISAVLLVSVAGDRSSVLGILHPEPIYPLDIRAFPKIPFVKIDRWPIKDGGMSLEWVVGQPSGREFKHRTIRYRGDAFSLALNAIRQKRKSATAGV